SRCGPHAGCRWSRGGRRGGHAGWRGPHAGWRGPHGGWRGGRRSRHRGGVIRLDGATVLLQWAVGGLLFLWVTGRRREVGLGYGWLLRGVYGLLALSAFATGAVTGHRSAGRRVC